MYRILQTLLFTFMSPYPRFRFHVITLAQREIDETRVLHTHKRTGAQLQTRRNKHVGVRTRKRHEIFFPYFHEGKRSTESSQIR